MSMTLIKGDLCSKEDEKQSVIINELLYLIASNIDKHVVGKIRYSFCELRGNFFFALTFFSSISGSYIFLYLSKRIFISSSHKFSVSIPVSKKF